MLYMVISLAVLFLAACLAVSVWFSGEEEPPETPAAFSSEDDEREAYYRRNFWNYDGSEQQDWNE